MFSLPSTKSKSNVKLLNFLLMTLLSIFIFTGCASQKTIVNGLDEREANEILVFLASRGIDAMKVKEGSEGGGGSKLVLWDISVNLENANEAMALLNQNGLPRRRSQNLLGIFSNVGLVPSEMEQQIRYQAGLAEQIASTIRKIDGIIDAEVQISFPKEDPLNPEAKKGKITASVYVKHNGVLDDPNSHLITKIKRLVAASVTGLDYDNVTVIPDRARYNEMPPGFLTPGADQEKQYVNVWGLIIGKESLTLFRIVFFSFLLLILVGTIALIWLGWKFYPVIRDHGGIKELFHLQPIHLEKKEDASSQQKEEDKKDEKKKADGEQESTDKDFDET